MHESSDKISDNVKMRRTCQCRSDFFVKVGEEDGGGRAAVGRVLGELLDARARGVAVDAPVALEPSAGPAQVVVGHLAALTLQRRLDPKAKWA